MSDGKINTWGDMDIPMIENAYNNIAPLIAGEYPDRKVRTKIKKLMEAFLPEYDIKCDEENNPPDVMDSGNVMVKVSTKIKSDGSHNYINVIF